MSQFPLFRPSALTCPVAAGLTILSGVAWSNTRYIQNGNGYAACSRVTKPEDLYLSHIPESVFIANNHDFKCHKHARELIKYLDERANNLSVLNRRKGLVTGDFYVDYESGKIRSNKLGSRYKPRRRRRGGAISWIQSKRTVYIYIFLFDSNSLNVFDDKINKTRNPIYKSI